MRLLPPLNDGSKSSNDPNKSKTRLHLRWIKTIKFQLTYFFAVVRLYDQQLAKENDRFEMFDRILKFIVKPEKMLSF